MYDFSKMKAILASWGIPFTEKQEQQFRLYYQLLIEWNEKINLTSIIEFDEVIEKHFIDSLSIMNKIKNKNIKQIIDIGTGAGFPGIPLKIMMPDTEIVLMDSLNKRIKFLNIIIDSLQLNYIEALHSRAEELAKNKNFREKFDLVTSRAVARLATLSEYCLPFVKIGGYFISYKGTEIKEELEEAKKAIYILGGKLDQVEKFTLPSTEYGRSFIMIKKERNTPMKYPRKAGIPSKEPIL